MLIFIFLCASPLTQSLSIFQCAVANHGSVVLTLANAWPQRHGRFLRHDSANPFERSHRGKVEKIAAKPDEREGPASQNDERNPARNKGFHISRISGLLS